MKTLKFLSLLVIGGMVFFGCKNATNNESAEDDATSESTTTGVTLEFAEDTVALADGVGALAFTVSNAGGAFTYAYSDEADWLETSASDVTESTSGVFTFTAAAYEGEEDRSTTVTVTYTLGEESATATATVTQSGSSSVAAE